MLVYKLYHQSTDENDTYRSSVHCTMAASHNICPCNQSERNLEWIFYVVNHSSMGVHGRGYRHRYIGPLHFQLVPDSLQPMNAR